MVAAGRIRFTVEVDAGKAECRTLAILRLRRWVKAAKRGYGLRVVQIAELSQVDNQKTGGQEE